MYCGAFMTVTYHDYPNPLFPLWDRERPKMAKKPIHFEKVISSSRGSNPYPLDIRCGFSRCSQMMKKYHPEPLCYRVTFFEKKENETFFGFPSFFWYISSIISTSKFVSSLRVINCQSPFSYIQCHIFIFYIGKVLSV